MPSKSEKVFYGEGFSYDACKWLEHMSRETGRHIHHALCGDGGERVIRYGKKENQVYLVDGYEPQTKTVYEDYGCKWHGCPCQGTNTNKYRYTATKSKEEGIRKLGYNLVTVWESPLHQRQTSDLTYISEHVPVSVAIHDSLNWDPTFLEDDDPKILVERFVEQLENRHALIVKEVERMFPRPDDFDMLPNKTQKAWNEWVNQVAVIGFNSGNYYRWCKSLDCKLEKLVFPYEWLTSYDKLNHVGPVAYEQFYSCLIGKNTLSLDEYETFRAEFYKRGCVTIMDWLREYNLADVESFIEAVDKTRLQYYDDEIDILKDAVSIPGVSMRYVLNKSLRLNPKLELYAPGEPCKHKCESKPCKGEGCEACKKAREQCKEYEGNVCEVCNGRPCEGCGGKRKKGENCETCKGKKCKTCRREKCKTCKVKCAGGCKEKSCKACKKVQKACTECTKNEAYELLQTGMVGGPAIVFCRYHERDVTGIRSHIYQKPRKCKTVFGLDLSMLYPSTLMQDYPCGKEKLIKVPTPTAKHNLELLTQGVQNGSLFGFAQVDIEVPKELHENFSEMSPLFVVKEIPLDQIPEHMHECMTATGRKRMPGTHKLLGLMKAEKILLYTPLLKWYLDHGLKVTAFHQFIKYTRGKPFAWFPKEIADARRYGDTAKLKGNSFYGKMIEDLARHANTTFTRDKKLDAAMRSPYLEDLEEIGDAYEIRESKHKVHIYRAYQCSIAVYQLAKLRMLEFYYDFIDNAYFAISGEELRDVVRPELLDEYDKDVKKWLVTDNYSSRTGGLFKLEFIGFRMIADTTKCSFVEGKEGTKFSCKGMSKKQNAMTWERYKNEWLYWHCEKPYIRSSNYSKIVGAGLGPGGRSKYAKPAKQDSIEKTPRIW
ncbi:uncharacterized protein LOC130613641 [Hydractinia symbiolongicarpus]|uniref:uncharacterized protein LOC130613641 n=1 Tax=Hydractinia symbiolongicarpus TaxID=13093 RepID=UPI002549E210|nr:uncharacterized protein LOC130613641 [Hydractinia symbiolongicarpus]